MRAKVWPCYNQNRVITSSVIKGLKCNGKKEVITVSRLFLIGSFSYLQVMRTYIKAYTNLNFGQIPPPTMELAALECLKNRCHHVISVDIDPIFFKLAGNKNMHNMN